MKVSFSGKLPEGITMSSTPDQAIKAYDQPGMDEECSWPGFTGRILAWRKLDINIAIEYADKWERSRDEKLHGLSNWLHRRMTKRSTGNLCALIVGRHRGYPGFS